MIMPNFIEYVGGDIYNDFVITKSLSKKEI